VLDGAVGTWTGRCDRRAVLSGYLHGSQRRGRRGSRGSLRVGGNAKRLAPGGWFVHYFLFAGGHGARRYDDQQARAAGGRRESGRPTSKVARRGVECVQVATVARGSGMS
jgi:hypothetical protein